MPFPVRLASIGALLFSMCAPLLAQAPPHEKTGLSHRVRVDPRLRQAPSAVPLAQAPNALHAAAAWTAFERASGRGWTAFVDPGSGRLTYAEGAGLPWLPGRGHQLPADADVLALLESQARSFLGQWGAALGVDPATLVLNRERSGRVADPLWIVDFDVVLDGIGVDGAHVVFRVNHGNLIQFGTEGLPAPGAVRPRFVLTREEALAALSAYLGELDSYPVFLDRGSRHLLPTSARGLAAVWQFLFRVEGEPATWRARVDAESGEVRELVNVNVHAQATGGVYPTMHADGNETLLPLPHVDLSTGGFANGAGVYSYSGGGLSSQLSGRYVKISDTCGPISLAAGSKGDLAFGASSGTDCATPGFGGAGNTHSARTQYYHVSLIQQAARGWFRSSSWLASPLRVNVNLELTCNAYWDGFSLNTFRSGNGCGNTGEIADVALHEFGHGLDANDGSISASELATGETYGDLTAALLTRDSCIGEGFFLDGTCGGDGDPCTQCTGVRDIDWARHASGTPHTVANFVQPMCPETDFYVGPCGRQGHCESQIASEALWDFAARDLPEPGSAGAWAVLERLWYRSRPMARQAFLCDTSPPVWTSHGCGTNTYWRTMRAVDDDDGNLANGTPHSCQRNVSPGFEPSPANRIATGVTGTSYTDAEGLASRQAASYVVLARDGANNAADGNRVSRSAAPSGPTIIATFRETFEGPGGFDNAGWQHANTVRNAARALDWTWVPGANGGSAWFADEDDGGASGKVLVSPRFGIGPQTALSFWHRFALQESLAPYCEDGGTLEISTDGGSTWSVLPQSAFLSGGFNAIVDESDFNPIGGKPAWCRRVMGSMSEVRVDLSRYAGMENARLRWYKGDDRQDAAAEPNGWYVDSVTIANTRTIEACTTANNALFTDGFEAGDTSRWSPSPPPPP